MIQFNHLRLLCLPALLCLPLLTYGQTSFNSGTINLAVPDSTGNAYNSGTATGLTVAGLTGTIESVTVNVNLGNLGAGPATVGDYYVALTETSGSDVLGTAVLLNRAGLVSGGAQYYDYAGFNFTFDDSAAVNAHFYQDSSQYTGGGLQDTPVTGTYASDGEYVNPDDDAAFTGTPDAMYQLGTFIGNNPNATWTLYLYDGTSGDSAQLMDWGLTIVTTPEPGTTGLLISGLILGGFGLRRKLKPAVNI